MDRRSLTINTYSVTGHPPVTISTHSVTNCPPSAISTQSDTGRSSDIDRSLTPDIGCSPSPDIDRLTISTTDLDRSPLSDHLNLTIKKFLDMDCPPLTIRTHSLVEMFKKKKFVTMCAPMVRYSKLPFRLLVRKYKCDVAFTPMIVSHSFIESIKARDADFTTSPEDRPLIAQFAAKNGNELAEAAEIVYRYTDGVDLNCGCPQRWALQSGYGACLLDKPELVADMIYQVKSKFLDPHYSISMKIRLHDDIRKTVELCQRAEKAGASFITVHGRTKSQRNEPVNLEGIKLIKENLSIPVIGNGDIINLKDAEKMHEITGVNGVMAARGLLQNPSLFTGADKTTVECVKEWMNIGLSYGITFTNLHHHLMFMLEHSLPKAERRFFNSHTSLSAVIDHLAGFCI